MILLLAAGASGDLAKKKTYPSLLKLFEENLLPADTIIYGYARTSKTHQQLRKHLFPHLIKNGTNEIIVQNFLNKCYYHSGKTYGDEAAYTDLIEDGIVPFEESTKSTVSNRLVSCCRPKSCMKTCSEHSCTVMTSFRQWYLAVPPDVFGESGVVIKKLGMSSSGWTRVVIEKPFGRDLASCDELLRTLSEHFDEHHLYRIDHYLGKEIVQNMLLFRFSNSIWEPIWNSQSVESVTFKFKEVSLAYAFRKQPTSQFFS